MRDTNIDIRVFRQKKSWVKCCQYLNTWQYDHWRHHCYVERAISATVTKPNGNFSDERSSAIDRQIGGLKGCFQRVGRLHSEYGTTVGSRRDPIFVRLWSGDRKTSIQSTRVRRERQRENANQPGIRAAVQAAGYIVFTILLARNCFIVRWPQEIMATDSSHRHREQDRNLICIVGIDSSGRRGREVRAISAHRILLFAAAVVTNLIAKKNCCIVSRIHAYHGCTKNSIARIYSGSNVAIQSLCNEILISRTICMCYYKSTINN